MYQAGIFSGERIENMGQTRKRGLKKKSIKFGSISVRSISMCLVAFMLGRVSLIGGLSPFGMAFFASTYGRGISPIAIGTSIIIGALTCSCSITVVLKLISTIALFTILSILLKQVKTQKELINCLKVFLSVFIVNVFSILFNFLIYDFLLSIFEAFISVMLYILFKKGVDILMEDNKKNIFNLEEIISLGSIGALTIAGIRDVGILGINFRSVVCIFIVLVFARTKGAGVGTITGVVMGLISGLTGMTTLNVVSSYALSGMFAGLFKKLGKIGVILGFITGNAILTYCITGSTEILIHLRDILLASAIFFIIPNKAVDEAEKTLNDKISKVKASYNAKLKSTNTTVKKLNDFSKAVEELAVSFEKSPKAEQKPDEYEVTKFFDTIAERVCKNCSLCLYCWDRNFNSTYQAMFSMLETLEHKGKLMLEDVPDCFSQDSCVRPKELVDTVNNLYEVYRVDQMWKKKMIESRGLVSQQLQGVSKIISQLANEINSEINFNEDVERKIASCLGKNGIKVEEVLAEQDENNNLDITVKIQECPGIEQCKSKIDKLVSDVIGKRMVRKGFLCSPEKIKAKCMMRFTNNETYGVSVGVSKISKGNNGISGDSYTFMKSKDKKYILGLSDGMGTGQTAANNSSMAMELLEKFLESGFDKDTAVKIINSVLVLKTADESYATMDISAIDLFSGQVEFVKIGSPPAYIKSKNNVDIIKGASLPVGVLESLDVDLCDKKVKAGDFIVMVSDGVTESNWENTDKGDWLSEFLKEIDTTNPQELADLITTKTLENYGEKVNDDVIALVAKVWERV